MADENSGDDMNAPRANGGHGPGASGSGEPHLEPRVDSSIEPSIDTGNAVRPDGGPKPIDTPPPDTKIAHADHAGFGGPLHKEPPAGTKPRGRARSDDAPESVFAVPTLRHFLSSTRIPQTLEASVERALRENRRLDHTLIHGRLGTGTALLARAMIADYAPRRMIEIDALNGVDVALLRRSIERVGDRGVLFIRHIEVLDGSCDQFLSTCISRGELPSEHQPPRAPQAGGGNERERVFERAFGAGPRPASPASVRRLPNVTIVATAHMTTRVGYTLRTRFEQMLHLRPDPRGMRRAVERALAVHGVTFDLAACPQVERMLASLCDGSEQLVRSMLVRAELDGMQHLDHETTVSVLEDDLSSRLPDELYAASLRDFLVGRDLLTGGDAFGATPSCVERIARETGWGEVAVRGALAAMAKEDRLRGQQNA